MAALGLNLCNPASDLCDSVPLEVMMSKCLVPLVRFTVMAGIMFALLLGCVRQSAAQGSASPRGSAQDKASDKDKAAPAAVPGSEYSGMYSFLRDGEFVQITVEEQGRVTGFVSRYGDLDSDRGAFLDHFFKPGTGKLEGNRLAFSTETVHGVWFEFHGTVERGAGKTQGEEAFYVLKGTLVENSADDKKKTSARSREVALKSFPQDVAPATTNRN